VIGIVANQSSYMAGVLDIDSSDKAARFVRTCNVFNIPIVTLVGHTWVHAWNAAGIRGHNTSRSKVALCLF